MPFFQNECTRLRLYSSFSLPPPQHHRWVSDIVLQGDTLYISDTFARKLLALPLV